eukprot:726671-Hanusia_phi.AAC.1
MIQCVQRFTVTGFTSFKFRTKFRVPKFRVPNSEVPKPSSHGAGLQLGNLAAGKPSGSASPVRGTVQGQKSSHDDYQIMAGPGNTARGPGPGYTDTRLGLKGPDLRTVRYRTVVPGTSVTQ